MIALASLEKTSCSPARPSAVTEWLRRLRPDVHHQIVGSETTDPERVTAAIARRNREQEFRRGRQCAKELLHNFGAEETVGVHPDRSPCWPNGIAGSISHSKNWTWAAVTRAAALRSIGIDTETIVTCDVRQSIESQIATEQEWSKASIADLSREQIFTVVFSAKEAFYKCWYPLSREFFGFDQARVQSSTRDRLRIRCGHGNPNHGKAPSFLDVYFYLTEQDVFTFTWMERN